MFVSYDGMVFDILKVDQWIREATYTEDLTTFLYWHHQIEVTCILNDDATNAENFPQLKKVQNVALKVPVQQNPIWQGDLNKILGRAKGQKQPKPAFASDDIRSIGLPTINPVDLSNATSKLAGGAGVGAPGESKSLSVVSDGVNIGPGFENISAEPGLAKGGPGPLPQQLLRKPPKRGKRPPIIRRPVAGFASSGVPFPRTSHSIPTTDRELRGRLNLPRRPLAIWMLTGPDGARDYAMISPQAGAQTDCKAGPLCTVMAQTEIHGQMTSVMKLRFETWEGPPIQFETVNKDTGVSKLSGKNRVGNGGGGGGLKNIEAPKVVPVTQVKTPPVLSHRWTMSFGWDPKTFQRLRRINGEVLFRSDVLELRNLSADQLRPYFMAHQIPSGYIRIPDAGDAVKLNSEGNGVVYNVTDQEQIMNFPGGQQYGLVSMEATTSYEYHGFDSVSK